MDKKSKKILISCDSPRSLLDFRGNLIRTLSMEHQVYIFSPVIDRPDIKEKLKNMGVVICENQLQPGKVSVWSDIKYLFALYILIKKIRPDVFFPYTFKPVIYGVLIAKLCGINWITPMLTGLGYNFGNHGHKKTKVQIITRLLLKFSLKDAKNLCVILQNTDDKQTLIKEKVITIWQKVFVVNGSGIDLNHYKYQEPGSQCLNFLMISRLINSKGINEFYESAKLIKRQYPGTIFTLIGPYEDNIDSISKELFARIKDEGVVVYRHLVSDIRAYIGASSVVVLPSYYGEGVPRCILEAMSIGRPVITSNSVGCKDTIDCRHDSQNGFLVPVKDVFELANKMEHYLVHPEDILRQGLNGRKYAREKFDVNKVNRQMVQILERAI